LLVPAALICIYETQIQITAEGDEQEHASMEPSVAERWFSRFEQLPTLLSSDFMRKRRDLGWTVQAYLVTVKITVKRRGDCQDCVAGEGLQQGSSNHPKGMIVVYQARFIRLLRYQPKNLRDQIILELGALQGWRTGEISTLRAEDVGIEDFTIEVLDSKKHRYSTHPLNYILWRHLKQYLQETGFKCKDYLIRPLPTAPRKNRKPGSKTRGVGLSDVQINWIFGKYSKLCGLPKPLTPREARAYFAANWLLALKKSIFHLKVAMRHDHVETTIRYVARIVNFEDYAREFHQGEDSPFSLTECANANGCIGAIPGCRCRMFQPKIEVTQP
jgi:site-specific recombinase XerC